MLTCHGCMRHCLQALIGDSATLSSTSRIALTSSFSRHQPISRRCVTTSRTPLRSNDRFITNVSRDLEATSREPSEHQRWLDQRGQRPANTNKRTDPTDREITMHLEYLKDPLKLAKFVRQTLQNDNFQLAEKLVHTASNKIECTVSWNHLIDWQLSKRRMNAAIKTYNDMKRRRQFPDGHTYTILFRGCAEHPDTKAALEKVMVIYQSMQAETSRVKPNVIHMNAVMKMCAKAGNIDALMAMMAQMSQGKGPTAPNNLTFTTILNAVRMDAVTDTSGLADRTRKEKVQGAIILGRRIWEDVIKRWRGGLIHIDEELVCAMGRLLLIGDAIDWDDVLSLVAQTFNIPRQLSRIGTKTRWEMEPSNQGRSFTPSTPVPSNSLSLPRLDEDAEDFELEPVPEQVEGALQANPGDKKGLLGIFAKPGQNSLSLVLEALMSLELKDPAKKYWKVFTQEIRVKPDADNFHWYLRILRQHRASSDTVDVLRAMPMADITVKTFRIAMATCVRDKQNPNSFSNAGKVLDIMTEALKEPDIKTLENYLACALTSPVYSQLSSRKDGTRELSRSGKGQQILLALKRLGPSLLNIKAIVSFKDPAVLQRERNEQEEYVDSAMKLLQQMIGAYDVLMNKALVPREWYLDLTKERAKLGSFVTRRTNLKFKKAPEIPPSPPKNPNFVPWAMREARRGEKREDKKVDEKEDKKEAEPVTRLSRLLQNF